ncbi:MAG: DNA-processing protein DprA [Acidimicrobiales bacterium]
MTVDPHLVALLGLPGLGPRRLRRLLDAFEEPGPAWSAVRAGRLDGVPLYGKADKRQPLIDGWRAAADQVEVDGLLDAHARHAVQIIGPDDDSWPERLVQDPEPPLLLFVRGQLGLLDAPAVAIVGTRRCTAAGLATARDLGRDLAGAGVGVVSGLALGIDGAAHRGCLEGGGAPVGVVATGLDVVYPRRHANLWEDVADVGVLISEAPLGTNGERWRFPARNRLIAALGLVVVVVESRRRGGSMLTVESAMDRGTEVLAVPGPIQSPASDGPNQLLFEGCGVVRDAGDILVALGTQVPLPGRQLSLDQVDAEDQGSDDGLDDPVIRALSWTPTSLDGIVAASGLSFTEVSARLATLELSGVVERVADGYQRRVA